MSDYRLVFYIGNPERAHELQAQVEWGVFIPGSAVEALKMENTYNPDLIILDMVPGNQMVQKVYENLSSFDKSSRMLILTAKPHGYRARRKLPRDVALDTLIQEITSLFAEAKVIG
jgi:response regulator RpfG family c-di-GMP phosphodiesterase